MINIKPYNLGTYTVPPDTINGICIDIGCNVGSFIKKYYNYFSKIYYYEPITQCFEICQSFSKNHRHIIGYNLAVWSESNKTLPILSHENNDSGSSAIESDILNEEWKNKKVIQSVTTISLEDILKDIGKEIDYCKCDCETSEYFIFLNKDISAIRYISMEIHWQMGEEKQKELLSYIKNSHDMIVGSDDYKLGNREVLFKRRNNE